MSVEKVGERGDGLSRVNDGVIVEKKDIVSRAEGEGSVVSACKAGISGTWDVPGVGMAFNKRTGRIGR
jgi:hypothetical protein